MKAHLKAFHTLAAKHHKAMAEGHAEACSKCLDAHADLGKDHPLKPFVKAMADFHEAAAGRHQAHSAAHFGLSKSLGETAHSVAELPDVEVSELSERGQGGGEADDLQRLYKTLSD
jgi:hypothetical protein